MACDAKGHGVTIRIENQRIHRENMCAILDVKSACDRALNSVQAHQYLVAHKLEQCGPTRVVSMPSREMFEWQNAPIVTTCSFPV